MSAQGDEFPSVQVQDILARLRALEQTDRRNAEEIFHLTKENKDLVAKLSTSEMKYNELSKKCEALEEMEKRNNNAIESFRRGNIGLLPNEIRELKRKQKDMRRIVSGLQKEAKAQSFARQHLEQIDKMKTVLSRALVQSHHARGGSQDVEDKIDALTCWKEDKSEEDSSRFEALETSIDALNTTAADIRVLQHDVQTLFAGKETKGELDSRLRVMELEISALKSETKDMNDHRGIENIICAKVEPRHFKTSPSQLKLEKYSRLKFVTGKSLSLNADTGVLTPREDGVFCLGWKFHQAEAGKIRYTMHMEGMKGPIYLGTTSSSGDVCTGTLVAPLKATQSVWMEAKLENEPQRYENRRTTTTTTPITKVHKGNLTAWQLNTTSLDVGFITSIQEELLGEKVDEEKCTLL